MTRKTLGGLFSGIGGFERGLELSGFAEKRTVKC